MIKKVYVCEICDRAEECYCADGWITAKINTTQWDWGIYKLPTHICPECVKVIKKLRNKGER
jgi:hypothetical protein